LREAEAIREGFGTPFPPLPERLLATLAATPPTGIRGVSERGSRRGSPTRFVEAIVTRIVTANVTRITIEPRTSGGAGNRTLDEKRS